MEVKNLQNQKGFTLVEIAIVLVIIGLLLGGVLKGQELIENSKIKSVTQDLDGISAAYYAYQDRTGRIAGDSATAPDGIIDSDGQFWTDLKSEGFIKGTAAGTAASDSGPLHALDGQFFAAGGASTNAIFTKNHICVNNIERTVARGMDTKLDDGVSNSGVVRVGTDSTTTVPTAAITTDATNYVATTNTTVMVCKEL